MRSNLRLPRGTVGRPRRQQQEIELILRRQRLSGLSLAAFAREHGLCYATLLRWRRDAGAGGRVSREAPAPAFIPVELEPSGAGVGFVLDWGPGRSLRIPSGFDPAELRRLLDVLGVRP